jgi:hypothetical protein
MEPVMSQAGELTFVATSLQQAAGIWDQEAAAVGSASARVGAMSLGRVEAGVFQIIVGPYDEVVAQVSARFEEGSRNMRGIASALELSAQELGQGEQANVTDIHRVHALQGMKP